MFNTPPVSLWRIHSDVLSPDLRRPTVGNATDWAVEVLSATNAEVLVFDPMGRLFLTLEPPPPADMIALNPPDLAPGDLGGQDSWSTIGPTSILLADFDGSQNFEGQAVTGDAAAAAHPLPDFSTASQLDLIFDFLYAADQGVDETLTLTAANSGSGDTALFVRIRYSIAAESLIIAIGDATGEFETGITAGGVLNVWRHIEATVTGAGTLFLLTVDGGTPITYTPVTPQPWSGVDTFTIATNQFDGTVNEWHGATLTLDASI